MGGAAWPRGAGVGRIEEPYDSSARTARGSVSQIRGIVGARCVADGDAFLARLSKLLKMVRFSGLSKFNGDVTVSNPCNLWCVVLVSAAQSPTGHVSRFCCGATPTPDRRTSHARS